MVRVVAGGELVVVAAGREEVLPVPVLVGVSLALVTLPDGGRVVQVVLHAGVPAGVDAGPVDRVAVDAVRLSCASSNVSGELPLLPYRREAYEEDRIGTSPGSLTSGCELPWPPEPLGRDPKHIKNISKASECLVPV